MTASLGGVDTTSDLLMRLRVEGNDAHVRADATHLTVRTDKGVPLAEAPALAFDLDVGTRALDRVALKPGMAVDVGDLSIPHVETWNAIFGSDKLTIARGEVHGRLHGELEPVWTTGRGELSLHGPLAVVANGTHVAAGVAVDAKVVSFDLDKGHADLSGSRAEARDVRVDGQSDGPWWGRTELSKTSLDWKKGVRVETDLDAQSADARPVLLFLADQGTIPGWVHTVLTLGNARGHAHIGAGPGSFDLDNLVVTASELDTRAFLHVHGGHAEDVRAHHLGAVRRRRRRAAAEGLAGPARRARLVQRRGALQVGSGVRAAWPLQKGAHGRHCPQLDRPSQLVPGSDPAIVRRVRARGKLRR